MLFCWNGKLLPQHVASQSTYPYFIIVTDKEHLKRPNTTKTHLDGRYANCIWSNERAYGHGCPLRLSKSQPFHNYTNASDYQLGSCIMQESQPVAFYGKKLNNTQCNYSTADKELISIVMTLREFWSILLGAELHTHTNCKNILHIEDSSWCRLQWISYADENGSELHCVEGSANIIADTYS